MPYKLVAPIMALLVLAASPSGADPRTDAPPVRESIPTTRPSVDAWVVAGEGLHRLGAFLEAVELLREAEFIAAARASARRAREASSPSSASSSSTGTGSGSCPSIPSWISQRESRCTYTARNASGAGGAYQLMPSTADALAPRIGRGDLVGTNPSAWPPGAQDAAAALLWNGGAGACNWTPPRYCAG